MAQSGGGHGRQCVVPLFDPLLAAGSLSLTDDSSSTGVLSASGREVRLRQLVREHFGLVRRSLRRLGLADADADDAAQEVYLVAARRLDGITPGAERAFLFATAVRVASTRRRSLRRRREQAQPTFEHETALGPSPEEHSSMLQARRLLDVILDGMDDEARAVFVLFELEHLSGPEIAALLAIPIGTVNSRLRRGRETFQSAAARLAAQRAFKGEGP
jgi:RNA polymerase sigma-70 factor, ECF subfamily